MPTTTIAPAIRKYHRLIAIIGIVTGLVLVAAFVILCTHWPFTQQAVLQDLQAASMTQVHFGSFHAMYFPTPGCVIENATFQHNPRPGTPPLITVQRITIRASYLTIFAKRIKDVRVEGMHILVPPRGSGEQFQVPSRSPVLIETLIADGTVLEVASSNPGDAPLKFVLQQFTMGDVGGSGAASFNAKLSNPIPPGQITTHGTFGPWNDRDVGATPVSGEYLFEQAELDVFGGIAGTLSSSGKFQGTLEHLVAEGTTQTPNFAVTSSSHQTSLQTKFQAEVNAENGDTFLQAVTGNFGRTTITSSGSVAANDNKKEEGKTASIDLSTHAGRIEDLLGLFIKSKKSPMSGVVNFSAKANLPPGPRSFLQKLTMQGDFGVDDGKFTNAATQGGVTSFSEGARGEKDHPAHDDADADTVLSDLKGHVTLKDGIATFSNLSCNIPGAAADLHGTYNLITEKIDLHGTLNTKAELYKTTHGVKSLMLKAIDPFFKKHKDSYIAPVKITGTYDHPLFGLDL